jgi:hypothetical protein
MASGTRAATQAAVPDPAAIIAAAAPATAAAAAPVLAVPVTGFALLPARASTGVIDMSDKVGTNLFNKGAEALTICLANGERGFNGKVNNLNLSL